MAVRFGSDSRGIVGHRIRQRTTLTSRLLFSTADVQKIKLPSNYGDSAKATSELYRYWITSSARASADCGMVRPRSLAVFRLITNSNFVGCSTGKSAGLAPLRILST